ncbi:MAG: hypothetical protein Ct9H300mP28_35560 [Pseudomonadota bacterium]|nr:MAG: hypothetical protein Ct9H300mP28_35560 [Pseudomonadota bacterium]
MRKGTGFYFPKEKTQKKKIMDLKVQQRDNGVRLSWKINQTERINRMKKFDAELGKERLYSYSSKANSA